jgi:hypothetical protein
MRRVLAGAFLFAVILVNAAIVVCSSAPAQDRGGGYSSFGKRDPFVPLVGVSRVSTGNALADILSIEDVDLQGIVSAPGGGYSAIINGEVLSQGDGGGIFVVEKVTSDGIKVKIGGDPFQIDLYED